MAKRVQLKDVDGDNLYPVLGTRKSASIKNANWYTVATWHTTGMESCYFLVTISIQYGYQEPQALAFFVSCGFRSGDIVILGDKGPYHGINSIQLRRTNVWNSYDWALDIYRLATSDANPVRINIIPIDFMGPTALNFQVITPTAGILPDATTIEKILKLANGYVTINSVVKYKRYNNVVTIVGVSQGVTSIGNGTYTVVATLPVELRPAIDLPFEYSDIGASKIGKSAYIRINGNIEMYLPTGVTTSFWGFTVTYVID